MNFLGYILRPYARYVRRSTLHNAYQKLFDMPADADPGIVRATANSYFGLMRNANAWRERGRFANALRSRGYQVDKTLQRVTL